MGRSKNRLAIRIKKITLTDFRNIEHAEIDIPGGKISELANGNSSILGIYGQNGSGKTSLLLALKALKSALCGGEFLNNEFDGCIRAGCNSARLEFEFSAYDKAGKEYVIFYSFSLSHSHSVSNTQYDSSSVNEAIEYTGYGNYVSQDLKDALTGYFRPAFELTDELLQYSSKTKSGKTNKQTLIDTSKKACKESGKTFGNKSKYKQLTSGTSSIDETLYRCKVEAAIKATSFIFAPVVISTLIEATKLDEYKKILESLQAYGRDYLFILMMNENAQNNMKVLPLSSWEHTSDGEVIGFTYPIFLFDHSKSPEVIYQIQKESIKSISMVISKVVPGLTIEVHDIGKTLDGSGNEFHLFDLISNRNGVRIPLAYESDGIRRLISFMSLLIAVFNNSSVTVAIDEIDSGIFEYMLGEILAIMKESAKGQLIFTSHNLRPLDQILPYKDLLFTTINPQKRFSKLEDISGNNNLRDKYLRYVTLDNSQNAFYDSTDSFEIEQAFFEAGLPKEN